MQSIHPSQKNLISEVYTCSHNYDVIATMQVDGRIKRILHIPIAEYRMFKRRWKRNKRVYYSELLNCCYYIYSRKKYNHV